MFSEAFVCPRGDLPPKGGVCLGGLVGGRVLPPGWPLQRSVSILQQYILVPI